jgi:hypothetical protein
MASFYYFLQGSPVDDLWKTINLSGTTLDQLIITDKTLYISPDLSDGNTVEDLPEGSIFIGNQSGEAKLLIAAALKLELGVDIQEIKKIKAYVISLGMQTRQTVVYKIQFKTNKSLSSISDSAISYLSGEKLSKARERYWLPCGVEQFHNLNISSKNEYPWIVPLTPFYQFFKSGIVLRSTSKSLDADLPILTKELRKYKSLVSESELETSLREFYKNFSFEPKPYVFSFWK